MNRDLRVVAQSIRRELESISNEENILVSTGFDKFRARFYIRDKTEFISISIDFESGIIPSIRASIKKKGNPVAERLVSLNLKNKYDKITEEQLTSIILIIKVVVDLIEGDWMSESEDHYLKAYLLDIEKFYSMEFNDKVVNDEIIVSFEKMLRTVMWDSLRKREDKGILHTDPNESSSNEIMTKPNITGKRTSSLEPPNIGGILETYPSLSVFLRNSDEEYLTVTVPKELYNELVLSDPSLQDKPLTEIIRLVINGHISNKKSDSNSMKNISTDFRNSDK